MSSEKASVYVVLLHHPMRNRHGEIVTTAVTNMDVHDISRTARTFGAKAFFIVTPIEDQHQLMGRILAHWKTEDSRKAHPDRVEAVSLVRLVKTFEDVKTAIREETGENPEVVLTDASIFPNSVSYTDLKRELALPGRKRPWAICFGTGWGVSEAFYPEVHRILAPVYGPEGSEGYNHLSVRSAAATVLDRLFGR